MRTEGREIIVCIPDNLRSFKGKGCPYETDSTKKRQGFARTQHRFFRCVLRDFFNSLLGASPAHFSLAPGFPSLFPFYPHVLLGAALVQNSDMEMEADSPRNSVGSCGIMVSEPGRVVCYGVDFIPGLVHSPRFGLPDRLCGFCSLSQVQEAMTGSR